MLSIIAVSLVVVFGWRTVELWWYARLERDINQQHSDFLLSQLKRKHANVYIDNSSLSSSTCRTSSDAIEVGTSKEQAIG